MLKIYDVALEVTRQLVPIVRELERQDPDLARQLKKARSSISLNIGEGSHAQGGRRKFTTLMLALTLILGSVFVGIKGFEYAEHIHEGLFPGKYFSFSHAAPELLPGIQLFMLFYWGLTALHARIAGFHSSRSASAFASTSSAWTSSALDRALRYAETAPDTRSPPSSC